MSERLGRAEWRLAYQSRSGPADQDWLEPDVADCLLVLAAESGSRDVVLSPLGFVCENMEIIYDPRRPNFAGCARQPDLNLVRAGLVGSHRRFVQMIRELVLERMEPNPTRPALGTHGPAADLCVPE